ncbi:Odorant receptor 20, partial [Frankliniella occidentalis]
VLWLHLGSCVVLTVCNVLQKASPFSVQTTMKQMCSFSSCYSGMVALTVIRQPRFWTILHEMKRLVEVLDDDPSEKVWVVRTRRNIVIFSYQTLTLLVFTAISVSLHLAFSGDDDAIVPDWPFVPYAGSWG